MEKRKKRGARGASKIASAKKKDGPKAAVAMGMNEEAAVAREPKRKAMGTMRSGASMGAKAKPMNAKAPSEAKPRKGYRGRIESMDL